MTILADGINLTVSGAVKYDVDGLHGYMHLESFRQPMGEAAYQELLSRPRVVCEYDAPIAH